MTIVQNVPVKGEKVRIMFVVTVKGGIKNWLPLHEDLIGEVVHLGLEVDWRNEEGPLAEIKSREDASIMSQCVIRAAQQAEREGYDAVVAACLLHPGVEEARKLVRIPVVGGTEAAMHIAATLGDRISFVIGGSDMKPIEQIVRSVPSASHLASIRTVGGNPLEFASKGSSKAVLTRMENGMRRAVDEDRADVIIGYGSLPLLQELRRRIQIPIVSPIQAGVLCAEYCVRCTTASIVES